MEECKKDIPCYMCMCYDSYNIGGQKYCKCGKRKNKKEDY